MGEPGASCELRFAFGTNWRRFLADLDEERVAEAERSLTERLVVTDLCGMSFLDVGSGSGLFSLAARRLGARVRSFDVDPHSVACTRELARRHFPGDPRWTVEQASVLDRAYLDRLGQFDVVYAWGVLHHTGSMWEALGNVVPLVRPGGLLFVAVYNDQGVTSRRWADIKRRYNRGSRPTRLLLLSGTRAYFAAKDGRLRARLSLARRGRNPLARLDRPRRERGMSASCDLVDWVGGYPFEVAKPEDVFDFYRSRGFTLALLKTCGGGPGCNEFVFERRPA